MKNIFLSLFLLFIIFNNCIFNVLSLNGTSWTAAFTILIFVILVLSLIFTPNRVKMTKQDGKILLLTAIIIVIGVTGSIVSGYVHSVFFITNDIIDFAKFPICFVSLRILGIDRYMGEAFISVGQYLFKFLIAIIFLCGIVSQVKNIGMTPNLRIWHGIRAYSFLFSHPTYFVASCIFMLGLISSFKMSGAKFFIPMLAISTLLALRTKGIIIIAIFIFIKYGNGFIKKHKNSSVLMVFLIAVVVGWSKVHQYLSFTGSARESEYTESWRIICDHFPIGSGFSSFGSFLSGKAYSSAYMDYPVPDAFDVYGYPEAGLGDTGYPYYIAQFGPIGFILFIDLLINIYKILTEKKYALSSLVIFFYLIFALTSESSLLNFGVEAAIVLTTTNYIENNY